MFEVKIKTRAAEFQNDSTAQEVRRLLKYVEALLEEGVSSGVLKDSNGNKIGEWGYE